MVIIGGSVTHGHPATEFLVRGPSSTAIPDANEDICAGEIIRGRLQEVGAGGNRRVHVVRRAVKQLPVLIDPGNFAHTAVGTLHAQRHTQFLRAGHGRGTVLVLDDLHFGDHAFTLARNR